MRSRYPLHHSTEEISWTFNDFILGFLMIVLMMASMFAFLSNSVVLDSFVNQCEDPTDPNCGVGNSIFGGRQKGAYRDKLVNRANPDEAQASIEASVSKWAGVGDIGGDSEVAFEVPKLNPQKENIVFEIVPSGEIVYRGETIGVEEMRRLINTMALEKGVFLEAIVHQGTPFEVYKVIRNQLWDLADAEQWRDTVQTSENREAMREAVSEYGTTYVESAETKELREAPRTMESQMEKDALIEFDDRFETTEP